MRTHGKTATKFYNLVSNLVQDKDYVLSELGSELGRTFWMYLNEKERIPIFHSLSRIFFFQDKILISHVHLCIDSFV